MKCHTSPFKWRHYAPNVILLRVRWYYPYQLSYQDVAEMMRERGLAVCAFQDVVRGVAGARVAPITGARDDGAQDRGDYFGRVEGR